MYCNTYCTVHKTSLRITRVVIELQGCIKATRSTLHHCSPSISSEIMPASSDGEAFFCLESNAVVSPPAPPTLSPFFFCTVPDDIWPSPFGTAGAACPSPVKNAFTVKLGHICCQPKKIMAGQDWTRYPLVSTSVAIFTHSPYSGKTALNRFYW